MKIRKKDYNLVFVLMAVVILVCFAVVGITGENGVLKMIELTRMKNNLSSQNRALLEENISLYQEIKGLHEPSHVERRARELGLARPGEIIFVDAKSK
jgi:cell division protein FtsB